MRTDTLVDTPTDTPQTRKKNVLGQVREALRSNRRGHSPLFLWMRAHHDELIVEFAANPPNWQQLAQVFRDEALTDRTGKAPSPEIARLTWYRVRQTVAAGRAKAEARHKARTSLSHASTAPLPIQVPCEPRRQPDRPSDASPHVQPATGGDDDPIARLRRTLNERSGRS